MVGDLSHLLRTKPNKKEHPKIWFAARTSGPAQVWSSVFFKGFPFPPKGLLPPKKTGHDTTWPGDSAGLGALPRNHWQSLVRGVGLWRPQTDRACPDFVVKRSKSFRGLAPSWLSFFTERWPETAGNPDSLLGLVWLSRGSRGLPLEPSRVEKAWQAQDGLIGLWAVQVSKNGVVHE